MTYVLALILSLLSSQTLGTIEGIVTDTSGAPLPGVTVTLGSRTTITDDQGRYRFGAVAPGRHTVRCELAGMLPATRIVDVSASKTTRAEFAMRFAAVSESITVTAAAPSANFTSSMAATYETSGAIRGRNEHGFIITRSQPVTTFAIDVDRASYSQMRQTIASGAMPEPYELRIEEMVNYFTYRYPQPTGNVPFSITTEVASCPWNARNRLLRIGIQGKQLDEWKMTPNNLVFLIDVSGSMSEELPLVKEGLGVLVERLRAEDRVAIVVYAGNAGLVLPSTTGADKETIREAIARLQAGGSTAGGAGIQLAYDIARQNFIKGGNNRVILATDGDFNVGISSVEDLEKFIAEKRETGVFLTTVGVGSGSDETLETLADKGNGNYVYLDGMKEAVKAFKTELTGTLVTIAKDVKVQLDFDPSVVASYRQIGYENRALRNEEFDDDTIDAGDLGAGHSVTALYEIVPLVRTVGPIATLRLRYKEPDGNRSRLLTAKAIDRGQSEYEASTDLQFAAAVAELGMLLRNSPHRGSSSFEEVLRLANASRTEDLDGLRSEFIGIAETAKELALARNGN